MSYTIKALIQSISSSFKPGLHFSFSAAAPSFFSIAIFFPLQGISLNPGGWEENTRRKGIGKGK